MTVRRALHALGALAALAGAVAYGRVCVEGGNDFQTFHEIGRLALARGDVYAPAPSTGMRVYYAPHFSLLVSPLALLPWKAAAWLWFAAKLVVLALLVRWARRAFEAGAARGSAWVALPFVLLLNPLNGDFKLGQVNLFVFALTLAAWTLAGDGKPWRAALLFSVALVKVTPWVFVPWFALRRQWRLVGALAVVGLGWLGALAAWFGPSRVPELFHAWIVRSRGDKLALGGVAVFENQSLPGVAARLASVVPALEREVAGVSAHRLVALGGCAALAGALVLAARRDRFRAALPFDELAFVCVAMLLCSPDTRWAHMVQLLAPLLLVVRRAAEGDLAPRVVLVLGLLAMVVLTRDVVGKHAGDLLRGWGFQAAFLVALAVVLGARMLGARRGREAG